VTRPSQEQPALRWLVGGGAPALIGLVIIIWPEPGLTPHPMAFAPSESTRPLAPYAVIGYPFLALGVLLLFTGVLRAAIHARLGRREART
jgi:hypothetical protein